MYNILYIIYMNVLYIIYMNVLYIIYMNIQYIVIGKFTKYLLSYATSFTMHVILFIGT